MKRIVLVGLAILLLTNGCGKNSVDELITDSQSSDPKKRMIAVRLLQKRQEDAQRAVPALIRALKDEESDIRLSAAIGLGYYGDKAKEAIPALSALTQDKDQRMREAATKAIERIDPQQLPVKAAAQ